MNLLVIKVVGLVVLFGMTFGFAMLPILIAHKVQHMHDPIRRLKYQLLISLISCVGGGIFLASCLLDLYPEVEAQLQTAFKKLDIVTNYPCAEFVVIVGFLLILICEQVVLAYKENSNETHPLLGHSHDHGNYPNSQGSLNGISDHSHEHDDITAYSVHEDPGSHSSLRSLVLVLALSLHSVFEGLAVGFQPDISQMSQILAAVLIHKSIIAFTLGLNLVQSRLKRRIVLECNLAFSFMSPLGMIIGILVMNFDKGVEVNLVSGVLQGLACGTFLYVTFFEVLPHELNKSSHRLLKLLFVVLGFSTISVLIMVLPS